MNDKNCNRAIETLIAKIENNTVSDTDLKEILFYNPDCKEDIESLLETWNRLEDITPPVPDSKMDAGFYRALESFVNQNDTKDHSGTKFISILKKNQKLMIGLMAAASIFVAGMLVGPFFDLSNNKNKAMSGKDSSENYHLTGIDDNQLTSVRLENVNKLKELTHLNQKIIDALNQALLKDPNINVRLSAIEAMLHFADNPQVRQNLIEAIPYQTSPIVQLTLAEVMIELQETGSKEAWKKLLDDKEMEDDVKKQLVETLDIII